MSGFNPPQKSVHKNQSKWLNDWYLEFMFPLKSSPKKAGESPATPKGWAKDYNISLPFQSQKPGISTQLCV